MRFGTVFFSVLGLDQLIKYLVRQFMPLNHSTPIIKPFLYLSHVRNEGAAFGFFQGMNWILVVCAVIVVCGALGYILAHRPQRNVVLALALIAGGAAGNLIDRLLFGGVVDYIDFKIWPVFNVADIAIVMGSVLIMICVGFGREKEEEGRTWKQ